MQAIVEKQPVWDALSSVIPKDYVLDKAHYVWWALLVRAYSISSFHNNSPAYQRTLLVAHLKNMAQGQAEAHKFWHAIDDRLVQTHAIGVRKNNEVTRAQMISR